MESFYIKGTKKRYSIRCDGNVVCHYRYNKNDDIIYINKIMSKTFNNKRNNTVVVNLMYGKYRDGFRNKAVYVNTLMIYYFKLKVPDKYHRYSLSHKDGDVFNHAVDNLYYRIHTERNDNYEPVIYYNGKNKIIAKKCSHCGEIKDIDEFHLQKNHNTYRNNCECCRSSKRWKQIQGNPELKERVRIQGLASAKKHRAYFKVRDKCNRINITDEYIIHAIMGKKNNDLTPEIIETSRNVIKLKRELKNNNIKIK